MARKHRRGGGKSLIRSIEKIGTPIALAAPAVIMIAQDGMNAQTGKNILQAYTGYNANSRTWSFGDLAMGWAPVVGFTLARVGAHKIIGLIRRL